MTEEQLRNYRQLKKEKRQIEQRLRTLERSPESDQEAVKLLRECYAKKRDALIASQLEIERVIETLSPVERELVRYRYFDGMSWYNVSTRIHYSEPQTFRLRAKVLEKLKKI